MIIVLLVFPVDSFLVSNALSVMTVLMQVNLQIQKEEKAKPWLQLNLEYGFMEELHGEILIL